MDGAQMQAQLTSVTALFGRHGGHSQSLGRGFDTRPAHRYALIDSSDIDEQIFRDRGRVRP
jgi:hypothetical protein